MKFSIIVPAYNSEATLRKCLQSIEKQIYGDFEVIIVDDGSRDKTAKIAEEFTIKDSRFICIRQENRGVSAARNRAINEAKGEFVVFLDSDDQYSPEYLQTFDCVTKMYPDCDHFWSGFQSVDIYGNALSVSLWSNDENEFFILDREKVMDLHVKTLDAALWNKAYRKEVLDRFFIRMNENLSLGEDLLFNCAYLDVCRTKIVIINRPVYIYSKSGSTSLDGKYRADLKEIYESINSQLLNYLVRWNVSEDQMKKFYSSVFYTFGRVLYNTYRPECEMSLSEKRKFNRAVLKSAQFQTAFRNADCYIHPLYRCACKIKNWELIRLMDFLVKLKNGHRKR